jgi:hypothetical protein
VSPIGGSPRLRILVSTSRSLFDARAHSLVFLDYGFAAILRD